MPRRNHTEEEEEEEDYVVEQDNDDGKPVYDPDQNADDRRRIRRNYRELAQDGKQSMHEKQASVVNRYLESLQDAKAIGVQSLTQKVRDADRLFRDGTVPTPQQISSITMLTTHFTLLIQSAGHKRQRWTRHSSSPHRRLARRRRGR